MQRRSLLCLLVGLAVLAPAAAPARTLRVLTVGNSFSHNATHYLGDLARAGGDTLVLREDNVGGASLELHWGKAQAAEKDPADPAGRYATKRTLNEDLAEGWDFVTIQQASIKSHDLATYRPFAKQLADYIHQHARGATLLLHETWEYRADDPRFSAGNGKPGEPTTQEEMYRGLAAAYRTIARELHVRLLPVGAAFHRANADPEWGYRVPSPRFDPKTASPGELPPQLHSLNVGWTWKKQANGKSALGMDGHHASTAGEYLGACVWYEVIFGRSAEGNRFVPPGLDAEYAIFLQATAHRVVEEEKSEAERLSGGPVRR